MEKEFTIRDNEIIIFPGKTNEKNLTRQRKECSFCTYDRETCPGNKKGVYCDWFTLGRGWKEINE